MSIRRRDFITLLGAAAAWPARAQQDGLVRRLGMLIAGTQDNQGTQGNLAALREGLAKLGWIEGRNLRVDLRFGVDDPGRIRAAAVELVGLAPDVLVTNSSTTRAVLDQTRTIPIVIAQGGDPVANGLVQNIARPKGNVTGFMSAEPSIAGKWLELLKEAAPRVARVMIILNPETAPTSPSYFAAIELAATKLRVQAINTPVHSVIEIVRAVDNFAVEPNGALIVLPPSNSTFRDTIIQLAGQHRLPAMYPDLADTVAGGLLAYGADRVDQYLRTAVYVDRLLRGAKVADLPVQAPTKYQLAVNSAPSAVDRLLALHHQHWRGGPFSESL
jgi:putative ABC transport system substrate-binding protein